MFTNSASSGGLAESGLPVENLTVEKSRKATVGLDFSLLNNRLDVSVEGFWEKRSDILVTSTNSVAGIIGIEVGKINAGINKYQGASFSLGWNDKIKDFEYGVSANLTYMTSEVVNENQAFEQYDYLYHKGNKVNQCYGLEAIGFFENQIGKWTYILVYLVPIPSLVTISGHHTKIIQGCLIYIFSSPILPHAVP